MLHCTLLTLAPLGPSCQPAQQQLVHCDSQPAQPVVAVHSHRKGPVGEKLSVNGTGNDADGHYAGAGRVDMASSAEHASLPLLVTPLLIYRPEASLNFVNGLRLPR